MTEDQSGKQNLGDASSKYGEAWLQHDHDGKRRRTLVSGKLDEHRPVSSELQGSRVSMHGSPCPTENSVRLENCTLWPFSSNKHNNVHHKVPSQRPPIYPHRDKYHSITLTEAGELATLRKKYSLHCPAAVRPTTGMQPKKDQVFTLKKLHQKISKAMQTQSWTAVPKNIRARNESTPLRLGQSLTTQLPHTPQQPVLQKNSVFEPLTGQKQMKEPQSSTKASFGPTLARKVPQLNPPIDANAFRPPSVSKVGIYDMMNNFDAYNFDQYLEFLVSLRTPKGKFHSKDMLYTQTTLESHPRETNDWLLSLIPRHEPRLMLRQFAIPNKSNQTLLARCVRYARSPSQQRLAWSVHPIHIALIVERTNEYGIAHAQPSIEDLPAEVDEKFLRQRLLEINAKI